MIRSLGFCCLLLLTAIDAHAQWSKDQSASYMTDCLENCQKNRNSRGECQTYCECTLNANQKDYPDFQAANDEIIRNPKSAIFKRFSENNAACGKRLGR